jgi:hypothetical protein
MGAVTMYSCSNEKYKRITSKDGRGPKKSTQVFSDSVAPQTSKKHSLNTFLSSSSKLKSSGNIL